MARDYKKEAQYESSPEQVRNRVARNKARREAEKAGKVHKGDGKDVDHVRALGMGGSTSKSNTRVVSEHENRSFPRKSNGKMKSNT